MFVALALGAAACANGAGGVPSDDPETEDDSSRAMPEGTGFDTPASSSSGGKPSSSGGTSSSSGGGSTSSGSTSTSSSGGTSTSSSSGGTSTSSSGASGSTTSSSSGAAGGACGVCDRNWTCNNITDYWATDGARCINQRTTTALRCDFKFDQGTSYNVGTWSGGPSKITLVYPMLGGGTKSYDCFP